MEEILIKEKLYDISSQITDNVCLPSGVYFLLAMIINIFITLLSMVISSDSILTIIGKFIVGLLVIIGLTVVLMLVCNYVSVNASWIVLGFIGVTCVIYFLIYLLTYEKQKYLTFD